MDISLKNTFEDPPSMPCLYLENFPENPLDTPFNLFGLNPGQFIVFLLIWIGPPAIVAFLWLDQLRVYIQRGNLNELVFLAVLSIFAVLLIFWLWYGYYLIPLLVKTYYN